MSGEGDRGELSRSEQSRYWLEHVEACERSGLTSKSYAESQGLSVSRLYAWRKRLVARGLWKRDAVVAPAERFQRVQALSPNQWSIDLPNGVRIGFSGAVDSHALSAVLGAAARL